MILIVVLTGCNKDNALLFTKKYVRDYQSQKTKELQNLSIKNDSLSDVIENNRHLVTQKDSVLLLLQEELVASQIVASELQKEIMVLKETIQGFSHSTDSLNHQLLAEQQKMLETQRTLKVQLSALQQVIVQQKQAISTLEFQVSQKTKNIEPVMTMKGYGGKKFTVVKISLSEYKIQLHLQEQSEAQPSLDYLKKKLDHMGEDVLFLMNAGMFTSSYLPKGLYIENGIEKVNIDRKKEGYGNFYLPSNGVFFITQAHEAKILKTSAYQYPTQQIKLATQSGPMLVENGVINSVLGKESPNFHYRNGIGVIDENTVVMIISEEPVRFYQLASMFKKLGCKDALYLDGAISGCWAEGRENQKGSNHFGPILSVCKK
ncbi:phosphodiester glycosidase family protein [Flammeovirga sp. SJP92]|uniref:phosphodiester glycosidase family protein n=1 Tax=Flammeovirga sp. SJP92 TaxID=1775430 RepID=UPI00155FCB1A|nr:phosphodiester glycosidase family protein [Flammeovirga sp. SJP92]